MKNKALLLSSILFGFSTAHSATLSGVFSGNGAANNTDYSLTSLGGEDWAYWTSTNSGSLPSNQKLGVGIIGNLYEVGTISGSILRPNNASIPISTTFSFTDGTSPTSASNVSQSGAWNDASGNTVGAGLGVDLTLPTAGEIYEITLFVSSFSSGATTAFGNLSVTLSGAPTYSDSSLTSAQNTKDSAFYTITASPDNNGDVLSMEWTLDTDGTGFDYVILEGVAISAIPEPSSYAAILLLVTGAMVLLRRRR